MRIQPNTTPLRAEQSWGTRAASQVQPTRQADHLNDRFNFPVPVKTQHQADRASDLEKDAFAPPKVAICPECGSANCACLARITLQKQLEEARAQISEEPTPRHAIQGLRR